MANLESEGHGDGGHGGESPKVDNIPRVAASLDRRDFFPGGESGLRINTRNGEVSVAEHVGHVSSEQYRQTSTYLETWGKSLLRLQDHRDPLDPSRTLFDAIQDDTNHVLEQTALQLLMDEVRDKDTGDKRFVVSPSKIALLLRSGDSKGWKIAMQLMDHEKAQLQQMLGMTLSTAPSGEKYDTPQSVHIRTGNGRGLVWSWRDREKSSIPKLNAEGEVISLVPDREMYDSISRNPREAAYLRAMTGVDMRDFKINASGQMEFVGPGAPRSNNIKGIQERILTLDVTRKNFLIDVLGVDPSVVDSGPEAALLSAHLSNFDRTGLDYEHLIQSRFQEIGGLDPADRSGSLTRLMQARRDVLIKDMQEVITSRRKGPNRERQKLILRERLAAREGDEARVLQERKEEFKDQKEKLGVDQTFLEGRTGVLSVYELRVSSLADARDRAFREASVSTVPEIEAKILEIDEGLDDITITGSFAALEYDFLGRRTTALDTALKGITTTGKGRAKVEEDTQEAVLKQFAAEERRLQAKKEAEEGRRSRLADLRQEIKNQEEDLAATKEVVSSATEEMTSWSDNFTEIGGWNIAGVAALTEGDIVSKSTDQILTEINKAHAADPTKGWSPSENSRADNRQKIERAKLEAQARSVESADLSHTAKIPNFDAFVTRGVTEHQLRTLTQEQLLKIAHELYISSRGVQGWEAADDSTYTGPAGELFENAKQVARTKLDIRQRVLKERIKKITQEIEDQDKLSSEIDLSEERVQIELTLDLMGRQGELFNKSQEFIDQIDRFTNTTNLAEADPDFAHFSPNERSMKATRGYYECLNFLFDYQENTSEKKIDRNKYFKSIADAIPPGDLAKLLDSSFGLGIVGTVDLPTVLGAIRVGVRPPAGVRVTIDESNVRQAMRSITDELIARARALH